MTDDEWNQQARTTAGAIESHNQATEDARRAAVNAYSEASDLIDDQEDLINEYRGSGLSQMRAVHSYVDGNNKDWEEVQKAIDAIAKKEKGLITNRRGFLAALGVTAASAAGGAVWATNESGQPSNQVTKASITNVDEIGNYLEDRVEGNEMLSAEANWGDLLSEYDNGSGEFFPGSDRSLEGIDVTLNPNGHSEYGVSMDINGKTEYETRTLREDKAAENALEYFGEL